MFTVETAIKTPCFNNIQCLYEIGKLFFDDFMKFLFVLARIAHNRIVYAPLLSVAPGFRFAMSATPPALNSTRIALGLRNPGSPYSGTPAREQVLCPAIRRIAFRRHMVFSPAMNLN
jgi:hypothetical protein